MARRQGAPPGLGSQCPRFFMSLRTGFNVACTPLPSASGRCPVTGGRKGSNLFEAMVSKVWLFILRTHRGPRQLSSTGIATAMLLHLSCLALTKSLSTVGHAMSNLHST